MRLLSTAQSMKSVATRKNVNAKLWPSGPVNMPFFEVVLVLAGGGWVGRLIVAVAPSGGPRSHAERRHGAQRVDHYPGGDEGLWLEGKQGGTTKCDSSHSAKSKRSYPLPAEGL